MSKKSKKARWGIQFTSDIGETCWFNMQHCHFASREEAEEWIWEAEGRIALRNMRAVEI